MTGDSTYIGVFSTGLWTELGGPSDIAVTTISGWVVNSATMGQLNAAVGSCFSGAGGYVSPDLQGEEFAILDQMYKVSYYGMRVNTAIPNNVLTFLAGVSEGDSKVQFFSHAQAAQVLATLQKTAIDEKNRLINWYIRNVVGGNRPSSVDFFNVKYPSPKNEAYRRW
jgi:hypothetical protein